jgi:hypothetical protein
MSLVFGYPVNSKPGKPEVAFSVILHWVLAVCAATTLFARTATYRIFILAYLGLQHGPGVWFLGNGTPNKPETPSFQLFLTATNKIFKFARLKLQRWTLAVGCLSSTNQVNQMHIFLSLTAPLRTGLLF